MTRYATMLSYSRADEDWVEVLHRHLEECLPLNGAPHGQVFFGKIDIAPGRSWVAELNRALADSQKVVLVATPESLASPWVQNELHGLMASQEDWGPQGRLLVARLRPVPLPPFEGSVQYVDFVDHDGDRYREALGELVAGLLGRADLRGPVDLPTDLESPEQPTDPLGSELRQQAMTWLAAFLQHPNADLAVEKYFPFEDADLREAYAGDDVIASAAVVRAVEGHDHPRAALRECLLRLKRRVDGELARKLEALLTDLAAPPAAEGQPEPLAEWLRHVARDCQEMKAAGPGPDRRRPLETVYVDLPVSRWPALMEAGGQEEARVGGGARSAAGTKVENARFNAGRLLMEDLLWAPEHLACRPEESAPTGTATTTGPLPHRWVVLGDPGAGKTTLLRHLAHRFATGESLELVPVFVSLPEVMAWEGRWFLDELEGRAQQRGAGPGLAAALETAGTQAEPVPLLVLADGLDEVSAERRQAARDWLHALEERLPEARVVVSSRPIPYESVGGTFEEVGIQPLEEEARVELVANHLAAGDAPTEEERKEARDYVDDLRANTWLWEWAGNPLYLGFLALLLRQGETPSPLRHTLYRQVIELMLRCQHRPGTRGVDAPGPVRELLGVLADRMTDRNETEVRRAWLEAHIAEGGEEIDPVLDKMTRVSGRYRNNVLAVFDDLERTGLLAPYADPEWRFLHRTFREALTAEHLARRAETAKGLEDVLRRAAALGKTEDWKRRRDDQARWAEPFALLAGQVEDRDGLVTALVGANRDLGLRALASTHDLRRETVVGLLNEVERNDDRARVIRSLPQVLATLDEVLDLVDELRRRTRNGDDLFWLDWVVREVARRAAAAGESALAHRATALLGDFFNHIPAPPAEVFRKVETVLNGVVPLWREIPAREFFMGSPEGEEGRFDDKGPQHRVEIKSGFLVAAVPVTRAQYEAFDPKHRSTAFDGVSEEELQYHPVNNVTWYAAVAFCRWLSQAFPETAGARLPTETEWEYACRAGRQTAYWSGDSEKDLDRVGWFDDNSEGRTHRVGEKPANPWGLYDVHGNVWEWTVSPWPSDYSEREGGIEEDPSAVSVDAEIGDDPGGGERVIRGGSGAVGARYARSAYRNGIHPGVEFGVNGFRVVLPAAPSGRS